MPSHDKITWHEGLWRHVSVSSSVQVMGRHLFGAKPISKLPVINSQEQTSEFWINIW